MIRLERLFVLVGDELYLKQKDLTNRGSLWTLATDVTVDFITLIDLTCAAASTAAVAAAIANAAAAAATATGWCHRYGEERCGY